MFKFRWQLAFSLLLFFVTSIVTAQKKYNSLFWEISGNGLSKPSYLYGTMHVSNKVAFHLSDSFFLAIKNVDVVALESNPENWMKELYDEPQNEMSISKNLPQNASSFYKNGFYLNIPENKDLKGVLKYYPQIVNNLLYRKRDGQDNFEENTYLDLFIMQSGRKYGKEIASLENYKYSQMLVDKASESIDENEEDQISWAKKGKILKGMTYSDIVEDAYRKGDLDFMDSIAKVFYPSKNYNKYMLEIRNEIMVKGMDSIMKQKRLFTGVGAAHLPGDKGVINMLIKLGYKVRPIFLNSELESKYKEEVEKINFPVSVSTYSDPDSLFSVEVPGKMHEIARTKSYKYYFYPDMVNGCFYMVMTVQNYGALLGQKPSDYAKKLDSLLFENIPGKINKKTPFTTSNGLNGYLIENTTKRGDQQFYKIIFSPTQLIIAKVNGNADYAKGTEAQRFLSSLKINDQKSKTFVQHNFTTIGASVYMPKHLQLQTAKDLSYRTFANYIALGLDENNKQYAFIRSVYLDFKYLEEDTFELNVLAENFCKEQDMKLVSKKLILNKDKNAFLTFTASYGKNEFYGKIVAAQPYYYMLLTNAKDKNSEKFFNSLALSNPSYTQDFEKYTDSTLYFSVNTIKLANKEKKFLMPYEAPKPKSTKKEPEAKNYYFSRSHYFQAVESNECVMVEANWFPKYSNAESVDTFWVRRARKYANNNDLFLKKQKLSKTKDYHEAYYTYTDTNTNQLVNMRVILKNELIYILRANTDSTRQHGKFTSEFFSSFTPGDTAIGSGIFESKANVFFKDLYSKDKATSLSAKEAIENRDVDFLANDDTIILRNIKAPEFHELSLSAKANIIRELGLSKRKAISEDLKNLFETYTDSTDIQLVILQTLAGLKTETSTKSLLDLLINDTPPLYDKEGAMDILYPYFDSLQLTKHLFPRLLDLTRYSEYKNAIHKLLAVAVSEKIINKDVYASYKPFLYKECKDELKRQFSADKEETNYSRYVDNGMYEDSKKDPAEKDVFISANEQSQKYFGNPDLYALCMLIYPFKEENTAKQLLDKMTRINNSRTKATLISYLLSENYTFPDSVLNSLAESNESRTYWYKRLVKYEKENLFTKKYLNQKDFAYALLFGNMKVDAKEDTIVFMERKKISIKNNSGYAYFYKAKFKDENNYSIYVTGLLPIDEKKVITAENIGTERKEIEKGDKEKELIDEMLQSIRMTGRKRFSSGSYY